MWIFDICFCVTNPWWEQWGFKWVFWYLANGIKHLRNNIRQWFSHALSNQNKKDAMKKSWVHSGNIEQKKSNFKLIMWILRLLQALPWIRRHCLEAATEDELYKSNILPIILPSQSMGFCPPRPVEFVAFVFVSQIHFESNEDSNDFFGNWPNE